MRRPILGLLLVIIPALTAAQQTAASTKQVVTPAGNQANPNLSAGIRVGDMLYVSGQLGLRRDAPDTTIEGQTKAALENTKRVVEAAGATMANVVKCTVFLVNLADFQPMNRAYREFFPSEPPARSTVVVAALVQQGAKVEIECMASLAK